MCRLLHQGVPTHCKYRSAVLHVHVRVHVHGLNISCYAVHCIVAKRYMYM